MTEITHQVPFRPDRDCDRMWIENYQLEEVLLPSTKKEPSRKAIRVVIRGRNFHAAAQPLFAFVGEEPVNYLRIAPDERSVEGILLKEPAPGSVVSVILGDQDAVRHLEPLAPSSIKRLDK